MRVFRSILMSFLVLVSQQTIAQELKILTSFPPDVSDVYVDMWGRVAPDSDIRVLNKNTVAGIDEVLRGNARGFDVFWASAPEAFELLSRNASFADETVCGADGPASVEPFAMSSVGWAQRADSDVQMPTAWNDLLHPVYRDKIAMARPARSGTTHMLVEQLLLVRGWEEGWAYLLELSGNLSTLTARSYGVPDGLANQRFEIGLTIDFLAQSRNDILVFEYGRPIVLVPAQIGILKGGSDPEKACEFVRMILSRQGQLALLLPEISRIPFDPVVRAEIHGQLPPGIEAALKLAWYEYDAVTSSDRYWAVNTLFDVMITETLVERRDLWRRLLVLRNQGAQAELDRIETLLTTIPITEVEAGNAPLQTVSGLRATVLGGLGARERDLTLDWRARVAPLIKQADAALSQLENSVAD